MLAPNKEINYDPRTTETRNISTGAEPTTLRRQAELTCRDIELTRDSEEFDAR